MFSLIVLTAILSARTVIDPSANDVSSIPSNSNDFPKSSSNLSSLAALSFSGRSVFFMFVSFLASTSIVWRIISLASAAIAFASNTDKPLSTRILCIDSTCIRLSVCIKFSICSAPLLCLNTLAVSPTLLSIDSTILETISTLVEASRGMPKAASIALNLSAAAFSLNLVMSAVCFNELCSNSKLLGANSCINLDLNSVEASSTSSSNLFLASFDDMSNSVFWPVIFS